MGYDKFFLLAFNSANEIPENEETGSIHSEFVLDKLKSLSDSLKSHVKNSHWSENFFGQVFHGEETLNESDREIIDKIVNFLSVIKNVTFVIYSVEYDGRYVTLIKFRNGKIIKEQKGKPMLVFDDGEKLIFGMYTINSFNVELNITEYVNPKYKYYEFSF